MKFEVLTSFAVLLLKRSLSGTVKLGKFVTTQANFTNFSAIHSAASYIQ